MPVETPAPALPIVRTGLERLLAGEFPELRGPALGLILHPASVTRSLVRADRALLGDASFRLVALYGPQHGVRGEKQDNMIESAFFRDRDTKLPVYSLYGDVRKPKPEMLSGVEAILFDLQDVGVRVYTFVWTMLLAMEACREAGVRFVVLDRPNPIGGQVIEGTLLDRAYASFVGLEPLPLRHGLTTGELARYANVEFGIGCELEVIPCDGWKRPMWLDTCELPYVMPSPNLPTLDSCAVYPGMVLLEGTNLSEGRGTTRPFELFGAPFLDSDELVQQLESRGLSGVRFRPCSFEPTFQKHAGQLCGGAQLHVIDRDQLRSVEVALTILRVVSDLAPEHFAWRSPPYEYEYEKLPIDILWGGPGLREGIDAGAEPARILETAVTHISEFQDRVRPYLLYPDA